MAKTILIVDNDPITVQSLKKHLSTSGYRVVTCGDRQSALIAIHEGLRVDLLITDYRIPGMDGLELVTRIKRYAPHVPVIMCSVHMRIDVYLKALGLGLVEYLEKPVHPDELTQIVALALEGPAKRSSETTMAD